MGADSVGVNTTTLVANVRADEKVFINGPYMIGFTTSYRMGQLLQYSLKRINHPKDMDNHEFMVTKFIPAVRVVFSDGGFSSGGDFLVGYRGELFQIAADYQVGIPADSFAAVGCGEGICCGSLHSTQRYKIKAEDRILLALEAAERFSAGVRGPFIIKRQKIK